MIFLTELVGYRVIRAQGDSSQQLIACDLQVLDRVSERSQLGGGIRLKLEKPSPAQPAEIQRGIIQDGSARAKASEPSLNEGDLFPGCCCMLQIVFG